MDDTIHTASEALDLSSLSSPRMRTENALVIPKETQDRLRRSGKIENRIDSFTFSSKAEAVCGLMLEQYIPNFQLVTGETFQVPVGAKKIDFRIGDVFIEFHPINLRHEFTSNHAYLRLQQIQQRLPRWQRDELFALLKEEMEGQYRKGRRNILNCFDQCRGCELVVCADKYEFVRKVLRRFGGDNVPKEGKLLLEFDRLFGSIRRTFKH